MAKATTKPKQETPRTEYEVKKEGLTYQGRPAQVGETVNLTEAQAAVAKKCGCI